MFFDERSSMEWNYIVSPIANHPDQLQFRFTKPEVSEWYEWKGDSEAPPNVMEYFFGPRTTLRALVVYRFEEEWILFIEDGFDTGLYTVYDETMSYTKLSHPNSKELAQWHVIEIPESSRRHRTSIWELWNAGVVVGDDVTAKKD